MGAPHGHGLQEAPGPCKEEGVLEEEAQEGQTLMVAAPALPPSHRTVPLPIRWIAQKLWIGPFLVPDRPFFIHPPCLVCHGAIAHDDGVFRCLFCGREHLITMIRHDGRVTGLELQDQRERPTGRQLPSRAFRPGCSS